MIDTAQKNITELATQVSSLQGVLANKQSRGAFGQGQLEAIIADVLRKAPTRSSTHSRTGHAPIAQIFMPESGPLIIDAKFPLEAMKRMAQSSHRGRTQTGGSARQARHHEAHTDIAEKYLLPGETQDIALMFIPSNRSIADLHERFDDIVQRAQRARVMIVSPTLT